VADLVKRGGAALAKRNRTRDHGPRTEYLAFRLAGEPYAAPVSLIREILKPPPLTPVPRAPYGVMGIISVRGQIVTVVDLRRRLRLVAEPPTPRTRILLTDAGGGEVIGLWVDEVLQVYRLSEPEIERAIFALGGDVADHIAGIARPVAPQAAEGEAPPVIILLDLHAVLAS
jgi:purine-binding chemotaxis protein CheW